jgi:hypothetical protein
LNPALLSRHGRSTYETLQNDPDRSPLPMPRRGESVPFAFIADADRFRSNVAPPPRAQRSVAEKAGSALFGLTVVAGLVGSLILGVPALDPDRQSEHHGPTAAESR